MAELEKHIRHRTNEIHCKEGVKLDHAVKQATTEVINHHAGRATVV